MTGEVVSARENAMRASVSLEVTSRQMVFEGVVMGVCFRLCGVVGVSEGQGIGFAGSPRRGVMVSRSVGVGVGVSRYVQ